MHTDDRGFAIIEGIVAAVVVVLLLGTGWYVVGARLHRSTAKQATASSVPTKQYTDTAHLYTLSYPASWTLQYPSPGSEGAPPDWNTESRPVTITPPNAPNNNSVSIGADRTGQLAQLIEQNWATNKDQAQHRKINGYDAQYVQDSFGTNFERYTDDEYLLIHGSSSVFVRFRENYYHNWPAQNWDDRGDLVGVNSIINSITFTQ